MAQPIDIPILFTAQDLPKIDPSKGSRTIAQAVLQVNRQRQAKREYKQAMNAKMWGEFNKIVDVKKPLAVVQGAQTKQAEIVEGWSDAVAAVYANSNGAPTQAQLAKVEQSAQKIEADLARVKVWEDNWNKDMAMTRSNLDELDIESAQEVWNYDFKTPYPTTRLKPAEKTGLQIATNTKEEFLGSDSADSYTVLTGNKYKDRSEFDKDYYHVNAEGKPLALNYDAIKGFNDKAVFADDFKTYSIMNEFDKLGEVDQRRYINMAENGDESKGISGTGNKMDAFKFYYLDKYAGDQFGMKETRTMLTPKTSGEGYKRGFRYEKGAYQLDEVQGITFKSPEGEYSSNNYYAMPGITRSGLINSPIDMDKGQDLGKTMTLPVGSTHKIVGVDYDPATGEQMNHYQVKFPSQDMRNNDGETIYDHPQFGDGTKEELKEVYLERMRDNNEWIKARPKRRKELDSDYMENWGYAFNQSKPKTEKAHTRNIYAPAKDNPVDDKKYKVSNPPKIEVKEVTYTIKGTDYSAEAITKAAEQSGMSVEEYVKEANK